MRIDFAAARWIALICLFVPMLASCGGAAGGAVAGATGGGISGSGRSVGSITGFGSIILNGREFDTTAAMIVVEDGAATQADLRVGQVVTVEANFDDLKASRVAYSAQIKGPVQALTVIDSTLGTANITVLGQRVATNSATNLAETSLDPAAPNQLRVGDLVEVSGTSDANGVLVASYLETQPTLSEFKVIGTVTSLTATTFHVGSLTVDYSATAANPQAGATVEVRGDAIDFNPATGTLQAGSVTTFSGLDLQTNERAELEGYVTRFVSSSDFDVNGERVTTTASTTFEGGTSASLGLNVKVEVEGSVNASGALVATKVQIEPTGAVSIEGDVTQIDSTGQSLTVLGVTYAVRPETELEDESDANIEPFLFADINTGDRVDMHGFVEGTSVIASELRRANAQSSAQLRGLVTAINPAQSRVTILGIAITGDAGTSYQGATDQATFFNTVKVGDFVTAGWDPFTSTAVAADELSIEED